MPCAVAGEVPAARPGPGGPAGAPATSAARPRPAAARRPASDLARSSTRPSGRCDRARCERSPRSPLLPSQGATPGERNWRRKSPSLSPRVISLPRHAQIPTRSEQGESGMSVAGRLAGNLADLRKRGARGGIRTHDLSITSRMRYLCATRAGGPGWPGTLRDCSGGGWGGSREIRAVAWGRLASDRGDRPAVPLSRAAGSRAVTPARLDLGRAGQAGGGGLPFPTPCRLAGRGTQPTTFGRRLGARQRGIFSPQWRLAGAGRRGRGRVAPGPWPPAPTSLGHQGPVSRRSRTAVTVAPGGPIDPLLVGPPWSDPAPWELRLSLRPGLVASVPSA